MRFIRFLIGLLIVAGVVAAILWFAFPETAREIVAGGKRHVEEWVAGQIRAIAADHLAVTLEFESFEFERVDTVLLRNTTVREGDEQFVSCGVLRVTFAEVPRVGRPVVISRIHLEEPDVRLIVREDGELVGWSNLLRKDHEGERTPDGGSTVLSDVFAIRKIAIDNGAIEYQHDHSPDVMRFSDIDLDLDVAPDEKGWYDLAGLIERPEVLKFVLDGRLDLDRGVFELGKTTLDVALAEDQYDIMPPQAQSWLREHQVRGELSMTAGGTIPFQDLAGMNIEIGLGFSNGMITFDEYQLPVNSATGQFLITADHVVMKSLHSDLLGGQVDLHGSADLTGDQPRLFLEYAVKKVQLRSLLRGGESESEPKFAGLLDLSGNAAARVPDLGDTLTTTGRLNLEEGRLVRLPVISQLLKAVGGVLKPSGFKDRASARFSVTTERPREVQFENIDLLSGGIAARGDGSIFFDGRLDLRVNAGPLETAQNLLGEIGDILGRITDKLMKYHVTGEVTSPKVTPRPLGIGAG